jgi:hypothetical protein
VWLRSCPHLQRLTGFTPSDAALELDLGSASATRDS